MIQALADGHREAVILADIEEPPHKEVADRLGLNLSARNSRLLKGRAMLRESLDVCCRFERNRRGSVIDCASRQQQTRREC